MPVSRTQRVRRSDCGLVVVGCGLLWLVEVNKRWLESPSIP